MADPTTPPRARATHHLTYRREDREPVTIDELASFVQDCLRAEVPGDTVLRVTMKGITGLLNSIETQEPRRG